MFEICTMEMLVAKITSLEAKKKELQDRGKFLDYMIFAIHEATVSLNIEGVSEEYRTSKIQSIEEAKKTDSQELRETEVELKFYLAIKPIIEKAME